MEKLVYKYDFGLSFAGAQAELAGELCKALRTFGYSVFYYLDDEKFLADNLGKNLVDALAKTYAEDCRFCVVLLSPEYEQSNWARVEKEAIQGRELSGDLDFFLPVLVTGKPPAWLPRTKLYFDFKGSSVSKLASILRGRIEKPDITPFLLTLTTHMQREWKKAIKLSRLWQEWFGVDLFALPIRVTPAEVEIASIQDYAKIPGRKVALIGKPGSGKTTAVRRILCTALGQYEQVPIELKRKWLSEPADGQARVSELLGISSEDEFNTLEASGRLLLIFDALDQVDHMDEMYANIDRLATEFFTNSHFLVTCREEEYTRLPQKRDFVQQHIVELDGNAMHAFLSKMDGGSEIWDILAKEGNLQCICSNQFIFLMVVKLLLKHKPPPSLISEVYKIFLNHFLSEWAKREALSDEVGIDRMQEYLQKIAAHITIEGDNRDDISRDALRVVAPDTVVDSLLRHGFLIRRGTKIAFFQLTFQEYLFARWLFENSVFPARFEESQEGPRYKGAYLSLQMLRFYKEITGFSRI
ncbi:MAG: TIR domain-containing protein [Candidatus Hodarchaeota archaeon]